MKSFKVLLSFFLLTSQLLATHIFYVKTAECGGNDSNYGRSWSTAYADVQKAIDAAAAVATEAEPAQVWIAKGTYTNAGGTYNLEVNTAYVMRNNVEIYGGFAGTETKLEERVSGNQTILTTIGDYVFYNGYSSSNELNNTAKLDSVTITSATNFGYGISNYYASPTLTNCTISGIASYAIFNRDSNPTITNCTISDNGGYGISNSNSNPTIKNCTIVRNVRNGVINSSSSPTITNCTITENRYGISNASSDAMIINCTITENKEQGISNTSSSPTIINCIIWGNNLQEIYNDGSSTPILLNCVIERGYSGGVNIITEDPLLGELGNYGGSVDTIIIAKGSSAIGKGILSGAPEKDARGVARENPPCIGAFEVSTQTPTAVSLIAKKAIRVGKETEMLVYSDGDPDKYILYRDGTEIARQDTNVFKITPTETGYYKYSAGIIYDGNVITSEIQNEVRQILGNVIFVKQDGNDSKSGGSWDNALSDVQKAIDAASAVATDDETAQVWIARGTYTNAGGNSISTSYAMRNNVEIYGGFAGTETKLEERISGNKTILTTNGDYVFYNYYTLSNKLTNSARIDSVTIVGGEYYGIHNYNYSSPTIINCTIYKNGYHGIFNFDSSPTIANCTITANGGSGISNSSYDSSSDPTITNCTISDNSGYGISNSNSNPTITNCIIWGNTSRQIFNYDSILIVSYCVIEGGYADGTNIITEDPLLGELGNYGGFVDVIPVLKGSSAIGAGTTGENIPTTDARGVNRANPPTIGAYEYFVQTSFDVWAQDNNLTGENAKPEAIPHSDGITNLEKFTFGLDASKATSYAESGLFKQISYGTNVSFQYPVNKAATDVAVKALVSEDLVHWTEATATESGESGNMNIFEIKKPIPESGKLFFKVEINQ